MRRSVGYSKTSVSESSTPGTCASTRSRKSTPDSESSPASISGASHETPDDSRSREISSSTACTSTGAALGGAPSSSASRAVRSSPPPPSARAEPPGARRSSDSRARSSAPPVAPPVTPAASSCVAICSWRNSDTSRIVGWSKMMVSGTVTPGKRSVRRVPNSTPASESRPASMSGTSSPISEPSNSAASARTSTFTASSVVRATAPPPPPPRSWRSSPAASWDAAAPAPAAFPAFAALLGGVAPPASGTATTAGDADGFHPKCDADWHDSAYSAANWSGGSVGRASSSASSAASAPGSGPRTCSRKILRASGANERTPIAQPDSPAPARWVSREPPSMSAEAMPRTSEQLRDGPTRERSRSEGATLRARRGPTARRASPGQLLGSCPADCPVPNAASAAPAPAEAHVPAPGGSGRRVDPSHEWEAHVSRSSPTTTDAPGPTSTATAAAPAHWQPKASSGPGASTHTAMAQRPSHAPPCTHATHLSNASAPPMAPQTESTPSTSPPPDGSISRISSLLSDFERSMMHGDDTCSMPTSAGRTSRARISRHKAVRPIETASSAGPHVEKLRISPRDVKLPVAHPACASSAPASTQKRGTYTSTATRPTAVGGRRSAGRGGEAMPLNARG
eukprot:scaffold1298_cov98-Isochrysis_galbana.AAC.1